MLAQEIGWDDAGPAARCRRVVGIVGPQHMDHGGLIMCHSADVPLLVAL